MTEMPAHTDALPPRRDRPADRKRGRGQTALPAGQMFVLAVLAGAFIGFGAAAYTMVMTGADLAPWSGAAARRRRLLARPDPRHRRRGGALHRQRAHGHGGGGPQDHGTAAVAQLGGREVRPATSRARRGSPLHSGFRAFSTAHGRHGGEDRGRERRAAAVRRPSCARCSATRLSASRSWLTFAARTAAGKILAILWPISAFVPSASNTPSPTCTSSRRAGRRGRPGGPAGGGDEPLLGHARKHPRRRGRRGACLPLRLSRPGTTLTAARPPARRESGLCPAPMPASCCPMRRFAALLAFLAPAAPGAATRQRGTREGGDALPRPSLRPDGDPGTAVGARPTRRDRAAGPAPRPAPGGSPRNGTALCIEDRPTTVRGAYNVDRNLIELGADLDFGERLVILIHELRHLDQYGRLLPLYRFRPEGGHALHLHGRGRRAGGGHLLRLEAEGRGPTRSLGCHRLKEYADIGAVFADSVLQGASPEDAVTAAFGGLVHLALAGGDLPAVELRGLSRPAGRNKAPQELCAPARRLFHRALHPSRRRRLCPARRRVDALSRSRISRSGSSCVCDRAGRGYSGRHRRGNRPCRPVAAAPRAGLRDGRCTSSPAGSARRRRRRRAVDDLVELPPVKPDPPAFRAVVDLHPLPVQSSEVGFHPPDTASSPLCRLR